MPLSLEKYGHLHVMVTAEDPYPYCANTHRSEMDTQDKTHDKQK